MSFFKRTCRRCGEKIDKGFSYCPFCGTPLADKEKEEKDYGFLGKRDLDNFNPFDNQLKLPLGFNTLFRKLMGDMEKQFKDLDKELGKEKINRLDKQDPRRNLMQGGGISINISGGAGTPVIKVSSFGNVPKFKEMEKKMRPASKSAKIEKPRLSEEEAKKLAKLPREEAASRVRRLSNKVIYEIDMPEVKNLKDVHINQLENSIEVKAFSKDKAYFKFLPVGLPLLKYGLDEGKLTLELGEE